MAPRGKADVKKINKTLKIQEVKKTIDKKAKDNAKRNVNTRKVDVITTPIREPSKRLAANVAKDKIREIATYEKISTPLFLTQVQTQSPTSPTLPFAKSLSTTKTTAPKKSLSTTKKSPTKGKTVRFKSPPKLNSIYKEWANKIFNWNHSGEGLRSGKVMGDILTLDANENEDSIAIFLMMTQPQEKGTDKNCLIALLEKYKNYPFLTPTEIYVRYKNSLAGKEQSATKSISITPEQACSIVDGKIMEIYGNAIMKWGTKFSYRAKDKNQGTAVFNEKYAKMKYLGGGSSSSKQKTRRKTQRPRKTLKNKHNITHR